MSPLLNVRLYLVKMLSAVKSGTIYRVACGRTRRVKWFLIPDYFVFTASMISSASSVLCIPLEAFHHVGRNLCLDQSSDMAPRKKTRLPSRAASTPPTDAADLPVHEMSTPPIANTTKEPHMLDAWTDEQEISLLQSIIRWKPVGSSLLA